MQRMSPCLNTLSFLVQNVFVSTTRASLPLAPIIHWFHRKAETAGNYLLSALHFKQKGTVNTDMFPSVDALLP